MTTKKTNTVGKNYRQKSREELQNEINLTLEKLQNGVKEVFTSENYRHYLSFFAKMHNYSFSNTILILSQLPTASLCASFQTWASLKCHINKGEKGLKILVPIPYRKETLVECRDTQGNTIINPDGTPKRETVYVECLSFRLGNVFDISQTDGKLPTLTKELDGNNADFETALQELMKNSDIPISYDENLVGTSTNGYYHLNEHRIALRNGMSINQTIKTLIHEKAHSLLHTKNVTNYTRCEAEVQAESIAFVVCEILGLDTSDYSFGYVASWSQNKELQELQQSIAVIDKTSKEILKWITDNSSLTIPATLQAV